MGSGMGSVGGGCCEVSGVEGMFGTQWDVSSTHLFSFLQYLYAIG